MIKLVKVTTSRAVQKNSQKPKDFFSLWSKEWKVLRELAVMRTFIAIVLSTVLFHQVAIAEDEVSKIEDNSFLIEEAYNQEDGVVQHINLWQWNHEDKSWFYNFTQEWPVLGQTNQFSYTIPVSHVTDPESATGFGDLYLNYRYQAVNSDSLAIAPRVSLILPTGDDREGLGAGSTGYQFNLPVSVSLSKCFVTHLNAGFTVTPNDHDTEGNTADTVGYNYGASLIYLVRPDFNLMLEVVGTSDESVEGRSATTRGQTLVINPGMRFAIDFASGLQIVPGLSFPIGVGPSADQWSVLTYLSFEHPF